MYIPASLLVILAGCWLYSQTTSRALRAILLSIAGAGLCLYEPFAVLVALAAAVLILLPVGLVYAFLGAYAVLDWLGICAPAHGHIPVAVKPIPDTVWGSDKPWKTEAQYRNALQVAQWDKQQRLASRAS